VLPRCMLPGLTGLRGPPASAAVEAFAAAGVALDCVISGVMGSAGAHGGVVVVAALPLLPARAADGEPLTIVGSFVRRVGLGCARRTSVLTEREIEREGEIVRMCKDDPNTTKYSTNARTRTHAHTPIVGLSKGRQAHGQAIDANIKLSVAHALQITDITAVKSDELRVEGQ
jgi:hypothetical protein